MFLSEHLNDLEQISALRQALICWGEGHFRPFPWRTTHDPYHILMAEILLHRTQVKQVVPLYERLICEYPDMPSLAAAGRDTLRAQLFSLGLHWRIDLLHEMAQQIQTGFDGLIPQGKESLLSLPGISEYIASAVRCFAWNLPEALVDTNTVRITGRLLGWPVKDSSRRNARFRQALEALVDTEQPRAFNYALLDLAHLVCLKRQPPLCSQCPLLAWCHEGSQEGEIHERSQ